MKAIFHYIINGLISLLPPTRLFGLKRMLWRACGHEIQKRVSINGGAKIWGNGQILVDEDTWLGINFTVIVPFDAQVVVGSNVDVGPGVLLECGSHEVGPQRRRAGKGQTSNIKIGNGTWIGCRVTVLGGAIIGAGSVIAAGAVVVPGHYPDNVLLAGVPAKVVKQLHED